MTESESVALPLGDAAIFGTVYIIPLFFGFVKGVLKKSRKNCKKNLIRKKQ